MSNKLKAYILKVSSAWGEYGSIIEWAQSAGKAKVKATHNEFYEDSDYIDLRAIRKKEWDKYADDECVPVEELLKAGWAHYCSYCIDRDYITQKDIDSGEAFIVNPDEKDEFVKGEIICKKCYRRLKDNKNYKIIRKDNKND